MTDQELQQLIERISNESFQVPFRHTASFNSRLRSTGGRYMLETHNIEINPHIATDYPPEILVGVIKHELCHYQLRTRGMWLLLGISLTSGSIVLMRNAAGSNYQWLRQRNRRPRNDRSRTATVN